MATGEQIVALARQHLNEKYILGALAPKTNSAWHGPWDCAEFVSWCIFQAGGPLLGCDDNSKPSTADAYTGFWARDAGNASLAKKISVAKAASTPGAVVLRNPRPGMIGHIVFSDGLGGTVEAHSHVDGVVQLALSNRRWDTGLLVVGVDYATGGAVSVASAPKIFRLTSPHMKGPIVSRIQQALTDKGFDAGGVDGDFGPLTQTAVFNFQVANDLTPDGEVGPLTAAALRISLS